MTDDDIYIESLACALDGTIDHERVADAVVECLMSHTSVKDLTELATKSPLLSDILGIMGTLRGIKEFLGAMKDIDPQLLRVYVGEALMRELINNDTCPPAMSKWLVDVMEAAPLPKASAVVNKRTALAPFKRLDRRITAVGLCKDAGAARFSDLTHGLLEGVFGPNLVAAGGSVLSALTRCPFSDVDLFFVGIKEREEANTTMFEAIRKIMDNALNNTKFSLIVTSGVTTLIVGYPSKVDGPEFLVKVQFVQRLYKELAQVPLSFDLAPTRFVYDGTRFYGMQSGLYAIANGITLPDPLMATTPMRAYKYDKKGFTYTVPLYSGINQALVEVSKALDEQDLKRMMRKNDLAATVAYGRYVYALKPINEDEENGTSASTFHNHDGALYRIAGQFKPIVDACLTCPQVVQIITHEWRVEDPTVRMYAGDPRTFLAL